MSELVTVFGGGGFLGRYVVEALAKRPGVRVRVAERSPGSAFAYSPVIPIGFYQSVRADVTDLESVRRAVQGASAVVNLVGILKGQFNRVHVGGARHVAQAAAEAGAKALVHVSALGANPNSESQYGRSKGEGEAEIRRHFGAATILRPSVVFGPEDQFVNRFAAMARRLPFIPVIRGPARFQPVFAGDVGKAIAAAAADPRRHGGRAYDLGGPQVMTMRELNEWIVAQLGRDKPIIDVPDFVARPMAKLGSYLPGAPITLDQYLMLLGDSVVSGENGFAAFGLSPRPLVTVAEEWLISYRSGGRFSRKQLRQGF